MDYKQLRNEVQLLRDEIAIMKRKYEDIIYNLDTDNFSSRFVKEHKDMRTAIEITAEGIKTKVSKDDLGKYTTLEQTAEAIKTQAYASADLSSAIEIDNISKRTDITKTYCLITKDEDGNVTDKKYYYYNTISEEWEEIVGGSIYTVFEQTPTGFKLKGNVLIDGGKITWDKTTTPVQTKYSKDGSSWHDEFLADDIYMKMSFDGGKEWTSPMKVVGTDGKDGADGEDGSNASVTFTSVNNALGKLFKTFSGGSVTSMTNAYIYSPQVKGGEFYGSVFYAGSGDGYSEMTEDGFNVYDSDGNDKIGLGYCGGLVAYPYLTLGIGTGYSSSGAGLIYKLGKGLWIGDSVVVGYDGDYPGGQASATDISSLTYYDFQHATGIFIDFQNDKIYKYIKGKPTEL